MSNLARGCQSLEVDSVEIVGPGVFSSPKHCFMTWSLRDSARWATEDLSILMMDGEGKHTL